MRWWVFLILVTGCDALLGVNEVHRDAATHPVIDAPIDAPTYTCVDASACNAAEPVCDTTSHTCRGCIADAECANGVCTEYNGQCVDQAQVIYMSPSGADTCATPPCCTPAAPCATFSHAMQYVDATHRTFRVGNGTYAPVGSVITVNIGGGPIVFSGETLDWSNTLLQAMENGNGPNVVNVESGSEVVLEGMTLTGPNWGVRYVGNVMLSHVDLENNGAYAVTSEGGTGALLVRSSRVANNRDGICPGGPAGSGPVDISETIVVNNSNSGIQIWNVPSASVVNSIIANNGNTGQNIIGLHFSGHNGPTTASFNTIALNGGSGVVSDNDAVAISDSIVWGNGGDQLSTNITGTYSLTSDATAPAGTGNLVGDPGFADSANNNFDITAGSPAKDAADPTATVHIDYHGNRRPQGGGFDIGAVEIP